MPQPAAVIMAKRPAPGVTKTRLIGPEVSAEQAAEIAGAMLRCTWERLVAVFGEVVVAGTPDDRTAEFRGLIGEADVRVMPQGAGDLGDRLVRVWRRLGPQRPIAFFGADTPDVPLAELTRARDSLSDPDHDPGVILGPTQDGGYWAIGARACRVEVFEGIDWGSACVYDQTLQRIRAAGLSAVALGAWNDIDTIDDLRELLQRLPSTAEDPLRRLETRIRDTLAGHRPNESAPRSNR